MKFVFIYPPSADPTCPPLCLSRIKGAAESIFKGFQFDFFDENNAFVRYVINSVLSEKDSEKILTALAILKIKFLFLDIKKYKFAYDCISEVFRRFSEGYPIHIGYATADIFYDSKKIRSILDSDLNPYLEYFSYRLESLLEEADIVGISVIYPSQLLSSLTILMLSKKKKSDIVVIFGGPFVSILRERLIRLFPEIDGIVPGDAEAFFEFAKGKIKRKEDVAETVSAYISSKRYFSEIRYPADFSWMNPSDYLLPESVIPIDITRGCYYGKCVFCAYGHIGSPYRRMDLRDLIDTIKGLKERFKAKRFFFSVDAIDTVFLEDLAKRIIKERLEITYCLDARCEKRFKEEDFAKILFDSGCRAISFGMESASQRTLDLMKKGIKAEDLPYIFENLNRKGIHVQVHLIHGFPGEKKEDIKRTMEFLKENKDKIITAGVSNFTLFIGSAMEKRMKDYGIEEAYIPEDLSICYSYRTSFEKGYPDFSKFRNVLFGIFPCIGRLTGSTTDYLIYASHFSPDEMRRILRTTFL